MPKKYRFININQRKTFYIIQNEAIDQLCYWYKYDNKLKTLPTQKHLVSPHIQLIADVEIRNY